MVFLYFDNLYPTAWLGPVVFILVVDSPTRSLHCRTTVESRHSRMGFPCLPQPSAAAELFVVNLVAQHDPQPDPQFAGRRYPRLAHSFLDELAPIETF